MQLDSLKEEFVHIQELLESIGNQLRLHTGHSGNKNYQFDFEDIYQLLSDQVNESVIEDSVIESENLHDEKSLKILRQMISY